MRRPQLVGILKGAGSIDFFLGMKQFQSLCISFKNCRPPGLLTDSKPSMKTGGYRSLGFHWSIGFKLEYSYERLSISGVHRSSIWYMEPLLR